MSESDVSTVSVHLLPALIEPDTLAGGVALVADVLRATTVMVRALESGCVAIIPCAEVDEARAAAAALPRGLALLAGERQGIPIAGFDLGNSPDDYTTAVCRGKTLVMTTTNGTLAVLASRPAHCVGIIAATNALAATRWAASWRLPVHVVCAGTEGRVSLEDTLVAGEVVHRLGRYWGYRAGNDSALIAQGFYEDGRHAEVSDSVSWPVLMARGRGGRRVQELGLHRDIEAAARRNSVDNVPELKRDPLRIVWTDRDFTA